MNRAQKEKIKRFVRIKKGIRKKISGTSSRPRLTVFRSNSEIYCQIINDEQGITLASASSKGANGVSAGTPVEKAIEVGKRVAEAAKSAGVESVVFDRNGYLYHGRVKSLAEAAREAGLKF
jgi:large subunit ribosomal protein L18